MRIRFVGSINVPFVVEIEAREGETVDELTARGEALAAAGEGEFYPPNMDLGALRYAAVQIEDSEVLGDDD